MNEGIANLNSLRRVEIQVLETGRAIFKATQHAQHVLKLPFLDQKRGLSIPMLSPSLTLRRLVIRTSHGFFLRNCDGQACKLLSAACSQHLSRRQRHGRWSSGSYTAVCGA